MVRIELETRVSSEGGDKIETDLTKLIKRCLVAYYEEIYDIFNTPDNNYLFVYKSEAFTSKIYNSYVDFAVSYIGSEGDQELICHEIKISEDDFNSKYGSNFYGTKNYYVVPEYLEEYVKRKIDNNALYNNIGLIVIKEQDDGVYIKTERHAKDFSANEITYSIINNLIDNGTYVGDGNIELKKSTFKFFNSCDVFKNHQLVLDMIRASNSK